jgi:hypothetical protein
MGSVGRNIQRSPGPNNRLLAAERNFHLALKKNERLFEVMTVRPRTATQRNMHVNQAKPPIRVIARNGDRVRVPYNSDMREVLIRIGL